MKTIDEIGAEFQRNVLKSTISCARTMTDIAACEGSDLDQTRGMEWMAKKTLGMLYNMKNSATSWPRDYRRRFTIAKTIAYEAYAEVIKKHFTAMGYTSENSRHTPLREYETVLDAERAAARMRDHLERGIYVEC